MINFFVKKGETAYNILYVVSTIGSIWTFVMFVLYAKLLWLVLCVLLGALGTLAFIKSSLNRVEHELETDISLFDKTNDDDDYTRKTY